MSLCVCVCVVCVCVCVCVCVSSACACACVNMDGSSPVVAGMCQYPVLVCVSLGGSSHGG